MTLWSSHCQAAKWAFHLDECTRTARGARSNTALFCARIPGHHTRRLSAQAYPKFANSYPIFPYIYDKTTRQIRDNFTKYPKYPPTVQTIWEGTVAQSVPGGTLPVPVKGPSRVGWTLVEAFTILWETAITVDANMVEKARPARSYRLPLPRAAVPARAAAPAARVARGVRLRPTPRLLRSGGAGAGAGAGKAWPRRLAVRPRALSCCCCHRVARRGCRVPHRCRASWASRR